MDIIQSPINYMGSKYKLLDRLIPLFPKTRTFLDMFTGSGCVYMNITHLYDCVIINDIILDLMKIHKRIRSGDNKFFIRAKELSINTKHSQENYLTLRDSYNSQRLPEQLLALIWSCNSNMMRFNNNFVFNQTWGKRSYNKNTQTKLDMILNKDYSNIVLKNKRFSEYIGMSFTDTFIYLDPPYTNTEAGYNAYWSVEDENLLIQMLEKFIKNGTLFGISGVLNGKENRVFDFLKDKNLQFHFFGDLYKKISKTDKVNKEYYITNVGGI